MEPYVKRLRISAISLFLAALVLIPSHVTLNAGYPHGAYYSSETDNVLWFLHVTDLHVGMADSSDSVNLQWLVGEARQTISPSFIVATGDLTDSTNGNVFGYPNGPYQAEWDQYKTLLAGVSADVFYDLPGNHDAYNDATFAYYRANSVQGRAGKGPQLSWTRWLGARKYHFLGVNTAGNNGASFSLFRPWGDYAGLDSTELAFIDQELATNADADLTLVFGHHPVTDTHDSDDTWLGYGHQEFIQRLDQRAASVYAYGHTHRNLQQLFQGDSYTGLMGGEGLDYSNVASLAKDSPRSYSLVAIDCNGVSSVTRPVGSWPLVLITAPVDKYVGSAPNPYAYTVPATSTNPIRALVFDAGTISQVRYRIDGGTAWYAMSRVDGNPALWQGAWNASSTAAGNHTIEVQATGTSVVSDTITVEVTAGTPPNQPPTAGGDTYTTAYETPLNVAAPGVLQNDTDPDGDGLTAQQFTQPANGNLTFNPDGSFVYSPRAGFSGTDSFTYTASDGVLSSAPATVTITIGPAPGTDTVTIKSATYTRRRLLLAVEATSTSAPAAKLEVVGFGYMTYKTKTKTYTYQVTTPSNPGSVTVKSSLGGTATRTVAVK